jgi:hypothetical protein
MRLARDGTAISALLQGALRLFDLSRRQFFTIVGLFWAYVTVSNVLYAYGMRTGIAQDDERSAVLSLGCTRAAACHISAAAHPGLVLGLPAHPVASGVWWHCHCSSSSPSPSPRSRIRR